MKPPARPWLEGPVTPRHRRPCLRRWEPDAGAWAGLRLPQAPPQPHLWQDTAGWRSVPPLAPAGRWSHRHPSTAALVGGDMATLTTLSLKTGARPPSFSSRPPPRDPGPADTVPLEPQPGVRGCKPTLWPSASGRVSRVGGAGSSPAQGPMEQPPGPRRTPRLRRLAGLGPSATWGRASSCSPAEASAIGPELSMHQAPCKRSLRDPLHSIGPTSQVRKPRGRECP